MSNEQGPFFSIVIPTYNRGVFIKSAIDSVFSQVFDNFELLVVDDGSKDNTAEVVAQYTDVRFHYYLKENGERGAARNYGFNKAKGKYVLFLDSDDRLYPAHLDTLYGQIKKLDNPNFIATKYDFERDGQIQSSRMDHIEEGWYSLDTFVQGNFLACNICVRRENPQLRLFEEDRRYAAVEDWMFVLENMQNDKLYLVDKVTLTMNDHDQRSMRANNQALVRRLDLAGDWMQQHITLTADQRRRLLGQVYYLCAIHAYADGHRGQALTYARRAAPGLSIQTALLLLVRCLLGPGIVEMLKK
jgi:glycosyltransferase involved in cell wall biosynthesis